MGKAENVCILKFMIFRVTPFEGGYYLKKTYYFINSIVDVMSVPCSIRVCFVNWDIDLHVLQFLSTNPISLLKIRSFFKIWIDNFFKFSYPFFSRVAIKFNKNYTMILIVSNKIDCFLFIGNWNLLAKTNLNGFFLYLVIVLLPLAQSSILCL